MEEQSETNSSITVWHQISNLVQKLVDRRTCGNNAELTECGDALVALLTSQEIAQTEVDAWLKTSEAERCVKLSLGRLLDGATDWSLQMIQLLFQYANFSLILSICNDKEKFMVLEVLHHALIQQPDSTQATHQLANEPTHQHVHTSTIQYLCDDFTTMSEILSEDMAIESPTLPFLVAANEVELLCQLSTNAEFATILRSDGNLLKAAIALLRHTNTRSKLPGNMFTSRHKLSDQQRTDITSASGLKRDLVRLVGNLCHENHVNQDAVRELGGLSLILDSTRVDATNPYITQWSVLAIRNLCDHNPQNQSLVASLKAQGLANQVEELSELGVTAELVGEKIVVKDVRQSSNS